MASLNVAVGNLAVVKRRDFISECHKTIYVLYSSTAREEEGGTALKGLSHEIDFKKVVKNGQNSALIRAAAGFLIFRRLL